MQRILTIIFAAGFGIGLGVVLRGQADGATWATLVVAALGLGATIYFREKKKK